MDQFEFLERKCALRILRKLLEKDRLQVRDLIDEVPCGQRAVYTAFEGLTRIGLIREEREAYHNRRWLSLTEKGKLVARDLQEIAMHLGQE